MPITIRSHAAVRGIAAVAGLTLLGLAAGPGAASADAAPNPGAASAPHSSGHPTGAAKYADRLMTAYGIGDGRVVDRLATDNVVKALTEHDDAHSARWHRTSADSGHGYTWVAYTNLDSHEVLTLTVRNTIAAVGDGDAIREIKFMD